MSKNSYLRTMEVKKVLLDRMARRLAVGTVDLATVTTVEQFNQLGYSNITKVTLPTQFDKLTEDQISQAKLSAEQFLRGEGK